MLNRMSDERRRMLAMAVQIPANYSRKDAGANGAGEMKTIRDEIMNTVVEYKSAVTKLTEDVKLYGAVNSETKEVLEKVALRMDDLEARLKKPAGGDGATPLSKTIGALFIESEELKGHLKRGWHKGGVAMQFKSWFEESVNPQLKTTITTGTVGDAMPPALRIPGVIGPQLRELRVRDLLRVTPTTQNTIEFVKENVFTNAASPQVEASAKAESALTFTVDSAPVRTIAHWIPATRQVLDDMQQLMSYIDNRLRYGLKLKEEEELLSGDGTGVHLDGLITQATAYDTGRDVSGDTHIDTISHAITQARVAEFPVDGVVLHPDDWEAIRLIKDAASNVGNYVYGNPGAMQTPTIWGKPIVETTAIATGTFLVGAFMLGAEIFDRQQATVDVSTEHSDYFVKNMVAIRAEERIALAVYRPASFVYGSF